MQIEVRLAESKEFAVYEDGQFVHAGLVLGHNDGIDEQGFDHRALFQERKAQSVYPYRMQGVRVTAVKEHTNKGMIIKPYWRGMPEDVERIINDPESNFHKMAKQACIALLNEGKFNAIVSPQIRQFEFGGCAQELPIKAGEQQHFADVGVWDHRLPNNPIAMEVTYKSQQTKDRILRLSQAGVHVYNINILDRTREALRKGKIVNVDFYRQMMLAKKFQLKADTESTLALNALYIQVAMLKEQEERKLAMRKAAEIRARAEMKSRQQAERRKAESLRDALSKKQELERQNTAWMQRLANERALADKKLADHKALCRRCKHRFPCPYYLSSACGPTLQFACA